MSTLAIPTDTGPDTGPQVLRMTLDGAIYQVTLRYNSRAGLWRMDLADEVGRSLASGLSLRNAGLPANGCIYGRETFPPGLFLAVASALPSVDAGLEELGGRVSLVYVGATA